MVRMKVRRIAAALGVLIAIAMTPRAALALTLDEYDLSPIVVENAGSAPATLKPSDLLSGLTRSTNVYPDTTFTNIYGGLSDFSSYTETVSSTRVIGSGSGYTYVDIAPLSRRYDYIVGNYGSNNIPSNSDVYLDFYFVDDNWDGMFPIGFQYQVVTPSYVTPVLFRFSTTQGDPDAWFDFLPMARFVVDDVLYYRQSIVDGQADEQWQSVPRGTSSSMYYPFYGKAQAGTTGLKGFLVRGHITVPAYSTISGHDYSFYFALDSLKVRVGILDYDVMQTVNGTSSQQSTGVPVSTTITTSTHNQTEALLDTDGSDSVLSSQMGDGVNGFIARLGFIAQIPQMVKDLYDVILNTERNTYVHFPGVVVQGIELIPEQDVNVFQRGLGSSEIAVNLRYFNTIVLFIAWFNGMKRLLEHQLLGESYDPTETVE